MKQKGESPMKTFQMVVEELVALFEEADRSQIDNAVAQAKNQLTDGKRELKLKDKNFKVNSNGWVKKTDPNGVKYLENPEGDIWEYLKCKKVPDDLVGEQLFTWDAAMRETAKAGKRMPTNEEWGQLLRTKADMPNVVLAGYRNTDGSFDGLTTSGYFWSSLESGSSAWSRYLSSGSATVGRYTPSKAYGLSVRCLED